MALMQLGPPRSLLCRLTAAAGSSTPSPFLPGQQQLRRLALSSSSRPSPVQPSSSSRIAHVPPRWPAAFRPLPTPSPLRPHFASGVAGSSKTASPLETAAVPRSGVFGLFTSKAPAQADDAATTAAILPSLGPDVKHSDYTEKQVAYWLIFCAASVFGLVVFGGLTRLTESGLSITEWRPVTGSLPPMSDADWESEFAKYRASPEYAQLNPNMDLEDFKKIYFMEWGHRLWARFVGLSFALPAAYFIARRKVTARHGRHLMGITGLIVFQGFIGWWMVTSGLKDDLFAPGAHPRVSQYRLAAHLGTAFVCYGWMILTAASILRGHKLLGSPNPAAAARLLEKQLAAPALRPLRRFSYVVGALAFATAMSGAFVAGLDAGLIYNEFPKMGVGFAPPVRELFDRFYCRREDCSDLWWRNMLENPSTVQLEHRILAVTTCCAVLALFFYARAGRVGAVLPADVRRGTTGLLHLTLTQATLGFFTLVYMVPTHLAATHQAGALALLTGAMLLCHRLHIPRSVIALAKRRVARGPRDGWPNPPNAILPQAKA